MGSPLLRQAVGGTQLRRPRGLPAPAKVPGTVKGGKRVPPSRDTNLGSRSRFICAEGVGKETLLSPTHIKSSLKITFISKNKEKSTDGHTHHHFKSGYYL